MSKKILITGSAGFVGSHLVDHLVENTDWDIYGLDSFKHRGDSVRVYQDRRRYHIHTCDLGAPVSDRLRDRLVGDGKRFDYIINMASESHVDRSISDPVPFTQNNVNIALHALDMARKLQEMGEGPDKFIQISTDEVYGPALEGTKHKEWSPIRPSNPYASSKAAQEAIAHSWWRTYNIPVIITNTMNMIGERQDIEKFVPKVIRAVCHGKEVQIHGSDVYIGKRHYLHARNHADALKFLLNSVEVPTYDANLHDDQDPPRFNIVGDIEVNNLAMAQMIADIIGKPLHYKLVDFHAMTTRPGHDRRYALCGEKIRAMGWKAPVEFKESLAKTVHWYLQNKDWLK